MKTVETLPQTTFSGRRFTRKQLAQVQGDGAAVPPPESEGIGPHRL